MRMVKRLEGEILTIGTVSCSSLLFFLFSLSAEYLAKFHPRFDLLGCEIIHAFRDNGCEYCVSRESYGWFVLVIPA